MGSKHNFVSNLILFVAIVAELMLIASSVGFAQEPVASSTCLECHDSYGSGLELGPHHLKASDSEGLRQVSCIDCHANADVHVQDPSVENIGNPAHADVAEATRICTTCHTVHLESDGTGTDPHLMTTHTCTSCHTIHSPDSWLDGRETVDLCNRCHPAVATQFARQSNHPLIEGAVTCLSCHSLTGQDEPTVGHGPSANCYTCHPEQGGPFRYEHASTNSFSPNGGGCIACHLPHGSPNDRLLAQPGSVLCNQCHSTPPRHRTAHFSALGVQYQCVECHSDIHGSDNNPKMLDPELDQKIPGGNCYNPGCHLLN